MDLGSYLGKMRWDFMRIKIFRKIYSKFTSKIHSVSSEFYGTLNFYIYDCRGLQILRATN